MKKQSLYIGVAIGAIAFTTGTLAVTQNFKDVPVDHFAYDAILEGKESGLWEGYKDGTFQPDKNLTRGEMAVLLERNNRMIEEKINEALGESHQEPQIVSSVNYTNKEYGYSLQLSDTWAIDEREAINYDPSSTFFKKSESETEFMILPQGGFGHGLPWEEPSLEEITIDGKQAEKEVWQLNSGKTLIIVKFLDLPEDWDKQYNRIQFTGLPSDVAEFESILSSLRFAQNDLIYNNDQYDFNLEYPSNWSVLESETNGVYGFFFGEKGQDYSLAILPQGEFDTGLPQNPTITQVMLSGEQATRKEWQLENDSNLVIYNLLQHPQSWNSDNRIQIIGSDDQLEVAEEILKTLKF